jgi:CheY-like chemotaxis protein
MVYGFVKQSGGHVRLYSEVGHGTTVKLYLPRALADEDRRMPSEVADVTGGGETILVAEDDEAVRDTAYQLLTDLGYRVLRAKDAQSALTILESGAAVDLLFTDVVMPGPLKSPELARRVRERYPHVAVLFTSGYTRNAVVHGGKLDGDPELLPKPYTREALGQKIRHVLDARRSASPASIARSGSSSPARPPLRVLVVEDEALIQFATVDMLEAMGHQVQAAAKASAALEAFAADRFDVVLTDVGLPDMDGIELGRRLQAIRGGIAIIVATGHGSAQLQGLAPDWIVVGKPYDEAALRKAIERALRADGLLSPLA